MARLSFVGRPGRVTGSLLVGASTSTSLLRPRCITCRLGPVSWSNRCATSCRTFRCLCTTLSWATRGRAAASGRTTTVRRIPSGLDSGWPTTRVPTTRRATALRLATGTAAAAAAAAAAASLAARCAWLRCRTVAWTRRLRTTRTPSGTTVATRRCRPRCSRPCRCPPVHRRRRASPVTDAPWTCRRLLGTSRGRGSRRRPPCRRLQPRSRSLCGRPCLAATRRCRRRVRPQSTRGQT
mmetsp:Transcript_1619/g.5201  ORF Transcript_1619/g.5201 Transcript_1619/m.5201 type:complete len:238 (-) Transcript_1619:2146-2859(-)